MPLPLTIDDHRAAARRRLPRFLFDYLEGGAITERTLRRNEAAFGAIDVRQRVLRDVSGVSTATTLFGQTFAVPLVLAPVGMAGMYRRRGEAQAAQGAARAGIAFTLSTVSICDLVEVQRASGAPAWFQLYVTRDRDFTRAAIARAVECRAAALVLTVDMPVPGTRYRDRRSGLSGRTGWRQAMALRRQAIARPAWGWDVGIRGRPHTFGTVAASLAGDFGIANFWNWMSANFDPTVSWRDLELVRSLWRGPLIVKGLLDPEDAATAFAAGADAVVVSNHGGRQLDGAPATIEVLPAIRERVGGSATLLVDGGIRSGVDLFRALARGADAAMLGRPWVYALAAGGANGVQRMLATLRDEFAMTMALSGTATVASIGPDCLFDRP